MQLITDEYKTTEYRIIKDKNLPKYTFISEKEHTYVKNSLAENAEKEKSNLSEILEGNIRDEKSTNQREEKKNKWYVNNLT